MTLFLNPTFMLKIITAPASTNHGHYYSSQLDYLGRSEWLGTRRRWQIHFGIHLFRGINQTKGLNQPRLCKAYLHHAPDLQKPLH